MTATAMVSAPLIPEGLNFWENLIAECDRYTAAINGAVSAQGLPPEHLIACGHDRELHLHKSAAPSTSIRLVIDFFSWGPVISGKVTGAQTAEMQFRPEQWEVPIAKDLDGAVIAIFDEGVSFSAHDLARYVVQTFRRCYPAVSLPCEYQAAS